MVLSGHPNPPCRMVSITLITPYRTFNLCGTIINAREERGEEAGSHFNAKPNTLDTIKFALGEGSVFMIDGKQM